MLPRSWHFCWICSWEPTWKLGRNPPRIGTMTKKGGFPKSWGYPQLSSKSLDNFGIFLPMVTWGIPIVGNSYLYHKMWCISSRFLAQRAILYLCICQQHFATITSPLQVLGQWSQYVAFIRVMYCYWQATQNGTAYLHVYIYNHIYIYT